MIPYTVENWYWVVAGSVTHVYSSAAEDYVLVSDSTYLAWLAAGGEPTPISTEALLYEVLNPETPSAIERDFATGSIDPTDGGPWTFTATAGKFFPIGGTLFIRPFSDLSIAVIGEVKAFDGTDLTVSLRSTNATVPTSYDSWSIALLDSPPAKLPYRAISGLQITRTGTAFYRIKIGAGAIMDSTNRYLLTLEGDLTKTLSDVFATGDVQGGIVKVSLAGTVTSAGGTTTTGSGTAFRTDFDINTVDSEISYYDAANNAPEYVDGSILSTSAVTVTVSGSPGSDTSLNTANNATYTAASYSRGGIVSNVATGGIVMYAVYLIRRDSDGLIDACLCSLSPDVPDLPSGFSSYRFLGFVTVTKFAAASDSIFDIWQGIYEVGQPFASKYVGFLTTASHPSAPEATRIQNSTSVVLNTAIDPARFEREALTGDVTASANSNATTIANDAVTNTKLANMAEATFKMRAAGAGTGDPIDGTASQAKTALAITYADVGVREKLTANRTYYVRSDGSDSNTGLVDSSGGAFLTFAKAAAVAYTLDWDIYQVKVQFGAGSFAITGSLFGPFVSNKVLALLGDTGTPSNVTLTSTGNGLQLKGGAGISVSGFTLSPSGFCGFNVLPGGFLSVGSAIVMANNPSFGHVYCVGGYAEMFSAFTVSASCGAVIRADAGGFIDGRAGAITITLTGTPAWTNGFAKTDTTGTILFSGKTFSGSATGPRYNATGNSVIFTNSGGASYFPGNSAGSTGTGGQYL